MGREEELLRRICHESRLTNEILTKVLNLLIPVQKAGLIEFYATINGELKKVVNMFLQPTDTLPLSLAIVDAQGQPARVDGSPKWALTDDSLGRLDVSADGLSATLTPSGGAGSFKVQVVADADLGAGVVELLGELDIDVLSGQAVAVSIVAGEPVPQAQPAPEPTPEV